MTTPKSTPRLGRIALSIVAVAAMLLTVLFATAGTAEAQDNNSWTELAGTAACIESDTVQTDPAAADLSLGQTFVGQNGNRFTITIGGPLCSFSGAGCPSGLMLHVVRDVGTCLDAMGADAAVTAVGTAVDTGTTTLAYTGSETTLAIVGAAMLGAGALIQGSRRRLRD